MSPRPPATPLDVSASYFLDAAAELIDATFVASLKDRPARLRSFDFPAALQWLRIQDVLRLAQDRHGRGASKKAFENRWSSKDAFVRDAIVHTMLYRDQPAANPALFSEHLPSVAATGGNAAGAIAQLCDRLLDALLAHPRSFLLLHIGPLLDQHPDLRSDVIGDILTSRAPWYEGYSQLLETVGLRLRPGWTIDRFGLALQSMLDGFLMRSRIQTEEMDQCRWAGASLFADTVVAFSLGVCDTTESGLDPRAELDQAIGNHMVSNDDSGS